jgi:SAM-dependent methyltransferase
VIQPPYRAAEASDAFERERLSLLCQMTDPITIGRLVDLEVGTGWRCLEIGAGDGTIAGWLAGRVRPVGRVVATGLDPQFLVGQDRPNLEVRTHDVFEDGLEFAHYDLVHCRFVLMHLADPTLALARLAAAVRPGGWLIVEEADFGFSGSGDPWHPRAAAFDRTWQALQTDSLPGAAIDRAFGRRLPALLAGLGLREVLHEEESVIAPGGGPAAHYCRMSHQLARGPAVDSGVVTEADFETLNRAYDDPSFCFIPFAVVGAWGRAPVGPELGERSAAEAAVRPSHLGFATPRLGDFSRITSVGEGLHV